MKTKNKTLLKYCICLIVLTFLSSPSILLAHGDENHKKEITKKENKKGIHVLEQEISKRKQVIETLQKTSAMLKQEVKEHKKAIEKMESDLGFDSSGFIETASYRIASPSKKGFYMAVLFTGIVWIMFFYLIKTRKKDGS